MVFPLSLSVGFLQRVLTLSLLVGFLQRVFALSLSVGFYRGHWLYPFGGFLQRYFALSLLVGFCTGYSLYHFWWVVAKGIRFITFGHSCTQRYKTTNQVYETT